jgi:hypothetical protein
VRDAEKMAADEKRARMEAHLDSDVDDDDDDDGGGLPQGSAKRKKRKTL